MVTVWIAIQVLIGYNLVLPLLLYVFYQLVPKAIPAAQPSSAPQADYAIIVTAYEQTTSIPAVIASILKLDYQNYLVYIVADKCDVTKLKFEDPRVIVLRPEETLASNTRSHFYAIHRFVRPHHRLTIVDSDNLVEPDYLHELNRYFDAGYQAVQGVRKAKNLDSTYACLDAARDLYYHFYDGEALFRLGSSATLAGSGMAFTVELYKECLGHLDIVGAGFDKVLQYQIVSRGYRIAFNGNAVVYDEKTSGADQLVKQRARWINTWFKYFGYGFSLLAKGVASFRWNQILFGVVLLRPPLFMFLLLSALFMGIALFTSAIGAIVWLLAFLAFVLAFLLGLVHGKPEKVIYQSLVNIPRFMFLQVISLLKSRNANKISVATTHYHSKGIDEIKSNK